jgi:hypothetical protein
VPVEQSFADVHHVVRGGVPEAVQISEDQGLVLVKHSDLAFGDAEALLIAVVVLFPGAANPASLFKHDRFEEHFKRMVQEEQNALHATRIERSVEELDAQHE